MPSDDSLQSPPGANGDALAKTIACALDQAVQQLPAGVQTELATRRALVLRQRSRQWPLALAASIALVCGSFALQHISQDNDAMALDMMQADVELLSEIDMLESLAEIDET